MQSKPRRRVLIFSTAYFPHVGGAEVAIKEITNRISGEYEFDLICARYTKLPKRERIGAVTVYRVGWGIRVLDKFVAPFWGAFRALSLGHYDAYWAVMVSYGSGGAYIAQWFTKTPIILTLQEGDPPEYLRTKWFGVLALCWRAALSHSQAVTVISSYLGKLAKEFGYQGEPVLVPNGVDTKHFSLSPNSEELLQTKEKLRKKTSDVFLVTTSRLVHKNAVDDVIRALPLLPEQISFLIYGVGPDEHKLRALARKLDVQKRIRFMGHLAHKDMPLTLSACDVFIRPSRSEGMGNSFIEAMAAGLPVIGTQEGGIADFLFDRKRNPDKETTGWAVDKNAPEQIAEAVQEILSNTEHVRTVTDAAQRMVIEKYDWELIACDMKMLFDRTLEKR